MSEIPVALMSAVMIFCLLKMMMFGMREYKTHSFFFFFIDRSVKRWQPPLFGLSGVVQENMRLLESVRLKAM